MSFDCISMAYLRVCLLFLFSCNILCVIFAISSAGRTQVWQSKEIGEKQEQEQRKQSQSFAKRRKEKWKEISVAITLQNKARCWFVESGSNVKWLLHFSQCPAVSTVQGLWLGFRRERKEEEKRQRKKEEMMQDKIFVHQALRRKTWRNPYSSLGTSKSRLVNLSPKTGNQLLLTM